MTSQEPLPSVGSGGNRFTLTNGQEIELPPHDEFYAQLVARNPLATSGSIANRSAEACPIPEPAPVTIATLSLSFMRILL